MRETNLSSLLERLPELEQRAGITFEALNVRLRRFDRPSLDDLEILGEVRPIDGSRIERDIELVASAYDAEGRVVAVETTIVSGSGFYALEVFRIGLGEFDTLPSRVLLFPKVY